MKANKMKLQCAMASACLNSYDVCKIADIQYQTLRRIINGGNTKPATIGKIAKALNVSVEELIETAATVNQENGNV